MKEIKRQCSWCGLPKHEEGALISHTICDDCLKKHHPDVWEKIATKKPAP